MGAYSHPFFGTRPSGETCKFGNGGKSKGPVNCFKTHFSLIFSFNFLSITWIIQAQQVVRPLELSRAYILKPKPTRNTYQREWLSFHSRGIHSFRKLIGVVPKKCKEPLFCTSDISVVFSVFAACISVHAVPSRLYDCDARNDTMGYTASVCTADDAFTTARGAFCSSWIEGI